MKRCGYGGSNAPVLSLKAFKGFQGLWVTDYARNLPSAGGVGGLALSAGLGLGHGLLSSFQIGDRVDGGRLDRHMGTNRELGHQGPVAAHFGNDEAASLVAGFEHFAELHNIAGLHGFVLSGMGESYSVTSDVSMTVRQKGWAA